MKRFTLREIDIDQILSNMHEGVVISDRTGKIRFYNHVQARIDDVDPKDAIGRKITEVYRLDDASSPTMRCLAAGKPILKETMVYRTRLGKVANVINNVYPIYQSGKLIGAINFCQDFHLLNQAMVQDQTAGQKLTRSRRSRLRGDTGARFSFQDIVGRDPALQEAIQIARMSADSPSPVMICGKTGTGKEMFAQSIHNHSIRKKKRFIPVNCSAIPENLLEGILFGTSKGAFTGAENRSGLFEQADGGTIFLDELDAMPAMLQAKLLRVVQERRVRRLGSLDEVDLDVKIISAVSRPPLDIIRENLLRMDLFYRMGVVFVMLPPLAERKTTLEELIPYFIREYNRDLNRRVTGMADDVKQLFCNYHWPGNVRELKHVIEAAMNMVGNGNTIRMNHLPPHIFSSRGQRPPADAHAVPAGFPELSVPAARAEKRLRTHQISDEIQMICTALEKAEGTASRAARILGISPQSLHYKLKKHRINPRRFKVTNSSM